ncbi:murein transglycosylase, partial [Mesorhizobium sp. M7A.T.Ca.TU.009.01.3.2]
MRVSLASSQLGRDSGNQEINMAILAKGKMFAAAVVAVLA